jgi:hypothetical protein
MPKTEFTLAIFQLVTFFRCFFILAKNPVNANEILFLLQTALSIFFQEAAISSSPQGPGTHFGQVSESVCSVSS